MKAALDRPTGPQADAGLEPDAQDSGYFATLFQEREDDAPPVASWPARAAMIGAAPCASCDVAAAAELFARLWSGDRHFAALSADDLMRMAGYLEFVDVKTNREVIGQDEQGDYLLIVLEGSLSVDRVQPWGGRTRLAEARAGDMLGEMSLLDAGARFSACTTLTATRLAVLDARRLDEMATRDPRLALALLSSLSRRLSLRLRQVSSRLSALLSRS